MAGNNPCVQCGACCAYFRVSFFWQEADPENPESVPIELTVNTDEQRICMQGTDHPSPRCIVLQGQIGQRVGCSIYDRRPSPCREFGLHDNHGIISATGIDLIRCNQARLAWNLPPLTRVQLRLLTHTPSIRTAHTSIHHHNKYFDRHHR